MWKLLATLIITMICSTVSASADLFPTLFTPTPAPSLSDKAPSYSYYADVDPFDILPYAEGGTVLEYHNVKEESYTQFGSYLMTQGYEIVASDVVDRTVQMILTDGRFNIGISYDADQEKLFVIYEEGIKYEKRDLYPGYKRIVLGDNIDIPSLGTFQFTDFYPRHRLKMVMDYSPNVFKIIIKNIERSLTVLRFNFTNAHTVRRDFSAYSDQNDLFDAFLVYTNSVTREEFGIEREHATSERTVRMRGAIDPSSSPMQLELSPDISEQKTYILAYCFNCSSSVANSKDGSLAILLNFKTGDKYVLILREDGEEVGKWN